MPVVTTYFVVLYLQNGLLIVAAFDLDNFPHDIKISISTDFYSVGWRDNYNTINISDFVAQFEEYSKRLIYPIVKRKINHLDIIITELSATALAYISTISKN
uniref:Uncharacterized protein n=1 Tax=Glossina pallidipes TaxID=7398 RepID=A0A1A9ZHT1_GLOPL